MFTVPEPAAAEGAHPPVHTRFKAPVAAPVAQPIASAEDSALPLHPPIDEDPDFMSDDESELVWSDLSKFVSNNRLATAVFVVSFAAFVVQFRNAGFIDAGLWLLLGLTIIVNTFRHNFLRSTITPESETLVTWSVAVLTGIIILRSLWQVFHPVIENEAVSFAIATMSLVSVVGIAVFIVVVAILLFRHGLFKVAAWSYLVAAIVLPFTLSTVNNSLYDPDNTFLWTNPPWWASMVGAEQEEDLEPVMTAAAKKTTATTTNQLFDLSKVPPATFPDPPATELLEPGVDFRRVRLLVSDDQPGQESTLYIYTPQGSHPDKSLPCVLIAAGSKNFLAGKQLTIDDQAQHLPYVRAGFAVIAYEVDGVLANPAAPTDAQAAAAFKEFSHASAGLINARNALAFALEKLPEVNPGRLYSAGHDSAGTLALLFAEHEPAIKATIAFDPVTNLPQHVAPPPAASSRSSKSRDRKKATADVAKTAGPKLPSGAKEFAEKASPHRHESKLQGAVFIHHSGVEPPPKKSLEEFVARISKTNKNVKFVSDEVDPMATVALGQNIAKQSKYIAQGIQWLTDLPSDASLMVAAVATPKHQSLGPAPSKWTVQPDPTPDLPEGPLVEQQPFIPLPPGSRGRVITPSVISPYVAIGENDSAQATRQIWDLRTSKHTNQLQGDIKFATKPILSPDGRFLAGPIMNSKFIEVWNFETNTRISMPFEPDVQSLIIEFINDQHLLVAGNAGGRAICQLWDYNVGAPGPEFPFESGFTFPSRSALAVSPGGRYLAVFAKGLRMIDLTNGQLVGDVGLPDTASAAAVQGLSFSPDGTEIAGIFRDGDSSRLMSWHMADGALIFDNTLTHDVTSGAPPAANPLEFFPGNGAWLLYQRAIVDRRDNWGKYVWPLYSSTGNVAPEAEVIKVLDQDHLLVTSTKMLTTYKLPRDSEGHLALSTTRISADTVFKNRSGTGVSTTQANTQNNAADARRDIFATPPDQLAALGQAARQYADRVYIELIGGEDAALNSAASWFRQGRRPSPGIRWGIGVTFTGQEVGPDRQIQSEGMFAQLTGRAGPALLTALRQRIDNGSFGRWPEFGDPRFRDVTWLGTGEREELVRAATEQNLDAMLMFELNSRLVQNRLVHLLRVHLMTADGNTIGKPEEISLTYASTASRPVDKLWSELHYNIISRVDELFVLKDIPQLKQHIDRRVQELTKMKVDRPLPFLFEVRFYQANDLINADQAAALYDRVLGPGKGKQLATGDANERRKVLREALSGQ